MEPNDSLEPKEGYVEKERHLNYTGLIPVFLLLAVVIARISYEIYKSNRQKTRNPQDRRMYVGSRARPSFSQQEPTIYVSPANLPPPPKYECMAPPSYEEVVGVHYPQYSPQPITQPIASAMAQQSTDDRNVATSSTNQNATSDSTVITVSANDRRTSVTVATSS